MWGVVAGPPTSWLSLHIGDKCPLDVPSTNPHLSEDLRLYEGSIGLFIECPWRLGSEEGLICSWSDDFAGDVPIMTKLAALVNARIEALEVAAGTLDLELRLTNGLRLTAFCDSVESEDDNYFLRNRDVLYIVGPRATLRRELAGGGITPRLRLV
ncbi:MAG TPA: hypothetical protein VFN10_03660 [Thermoanaerobaculia bacterium]|nr:hypothetical protein [Thermoanaerobaculia bacterium]